MPQSPSSDAQPQRPPRLVEEPVPPIPHPDTSNADQASVEYSHYRTGLSHHRTGLSEHRTDLSEYRTDLSGERTHMSMRRTGMSFQRSRMSADRTLMSVMRTSLSLISFGFTIHQAFLALQKAGTIAGEGAARGFGMCLILLGVFLLIGGIIGHARYGGELRDLRGGMKAEGLIFGETRFPASITFLTAVALLAVGIAAFASILFRLPIFG